MKTSKAHMLICSRTYNYANEDTQAHAGKLMHVVLSVFKA